MFQIMYIPIDYLETWTPLEGEGKMYLFALMPFYLIRELEK